MQCIILAGGKGTRLADTVPDLPKCLAPVNGKAFLEHLISHLEDCGVDKVVLSLGYKYEKVIDWLRRKAFLTKVTWVIERTALGTGGGIKLALSKITDDKVLIINGDTMFKVNPALLFAANKDFAATLALKPMQDFERYGAVNIDENMQIKSFEEKQYQTSGLINGGVYVLNLKAENFENYPDSFSFEKDFLEKEMHRLNAVVFDEYFIDIGVPEDYEKAQKEL